MSVFSLRTNAAIAMGKLSKKRQQELLDGWTTESEKIMAAANAAPRNIKVFEVHHTMENALHAYYARIISEAERDCQGSGTK